MQVQAKRCDLWPVFVKLGPPLPWWLPRFSHLQKPKAGPMMEPGPSFLLLVSCYIFIFCWFNTSCPDSLGVEITIVGLSKFLLVKSASNPIHVFVCLPRNLSVETHVKIRWQLTPSSRFKDSIPAALKHITPEAIWADGHASHEAAFPLEILNQKKWQV